MDLANWPSGLHRSSPQGFNISSIRVFDQIGDLEIPIILRHVIAALQERNCVETTVFMQDGTPPDIVCQVQCLLRKTFTDDHIISRRFPNTWPVRSDLNPCDFWLWGYLKDPVYQGHVQSLVI